MDLYTFGAARLSAAFVPILFQSTLTPGVDITPAGLLVAGTLIAVAVASLVGGIVLRIMDDRFKARDEKRAAADLETRSNAKLIEAILVLGQGVKDSNAAQVKEREELRTMLQTKQEAKNGRDKAVEAINQHADAAQVAINENTKAQVQLLREDFTRLQTTVNDATAKVQQGVTAAELIEALQPIKDQLDNLSQNAGDLLRQKTTTPIAASNGDGHPAVPSETP